MEEGTVRGCADWGHRDKAPRTSRRRGRMKDEFILRSGLRIGFKN